MKTIHQSIRKILTAGFGVAAVFMLNISHRVAVAGQPFMFDIDFEYVDDFTCGTPVLVHLTGKLIERGLFDGDNTLTLIEPLKTDYTSLSTGKTVSTQIAGTIVQSFEGDGAFVCTGVVLIKLGRGAWVDAGITETVIQFDPNSGEFTEITLRSVGIHPGNVNEAICAALQ